MSKGEGLIHGELSVKDNTNEKTDIAFTLIPKWLYPLKDDGELKKENGFELCYQFDNKGITYTIPCIELVRALYGENVLLVKKLLTSERLEGVTLNETIDKIHIDFSSDIPKTRLTDSLVQGYVWLKHEPLVFAAWNKIFDEFISHAKKIKTGIPFKGNEKLSYYGIQNRRNVLILNAEFNNLPYPFQDISYTHPAFTETEDITNTGEQKFVEAKQPEVITLSDDATNTEAGGVLIEGEPSKHFVSPPKITRRHSSSSKDGTSGSTYIRNEVNTHSTGETTETGKSSPVDRYTENKVEPVASDKDFIDFCIAVGHIQCNEDVVRVDIEYGSFSGETAFSYMPDGTRRRYALATIVFSCGAFLSIIEACNTDGWPLSTLRIRRSRYTKALAQQMISKLAEAGGHWDKKWFTESTDAQYLPLKHFSNRSAKHWANLLVRKK